MSDTRYLFRIGFLANTWNQVSLVRGVDTAFVSVMEMHGSLEVKVCYPG